MRQKKSWRKLEYVMIENNIFSVINKLNQIMLKMPHHHQPTHNVNNIVITLIPLKTLYGVTFYFICVCVSECVFGH